MKDRYLETEKVSGLFRRLAIPAVVAQVVNLAYNMVDRIYIGHIPETGSLALTGVGVCMPALMILSAFAQLVGGGGAPRASYYMGKGEHEKAEQTLGACSLFLVLLSLVLTVFARMFSGDIVQLFGASKQTMPYALEYFNMYILGTVFVEISTGLVLFITAQGFSKISMISVLIGAALNIVLDPIFIFVFDMKVRGAALATVVSQAASAVWVLLFLCGKKGILRIRRKNLRLRGELLFPVLALGLSPWVMSATESILFICFNRSLLKYGGDLAVGAMTIFLTVMQMTVLPLQGFTQGAQPITSYNYGAGRMDRVAEMFKLLLKTCVIYAAILWAAVQLIPQGFLGLFADDGALVTYSIRPMRIYFAALFMMGVQIACQNMFLALGNAKTSLFLALLRKVVLLIPLIYLLPAILPWKVEAVFLAEPICDTLAAMTTLLLFIKTYKNKLFFKNQEPESREKPE